MRGRFGADRERWVSDFVGGGAANDVAKIVDLSRAKSRSGFERHEQASVAVAAVASGGFGFDDTNNFEMEFFGDDGKAAGRFGWRG